MTKHKNAKKREKKERKRRSELQEPTPICMLAPGETCPSHLGVVPAENLINISVFCACSAGKGKAGDVYITQAKECLHEKKEERKRNAAPPVPSG